MQRRHMLFALMAGFALLLPAGVVLAQNETSPSNDTNGSNETEEPNDTNGTNETNDTDDNGTGNETGADDHKMVICHVPPGNEENAHTIEIDEHAWDAHQDHGDTEGACPDDGEPETADDVDAARENEQITVEVDASQDTEVEQNNILVTNVNVEQTVQDADAFRMTFVVEGTSPDGDDDVIVDEEDDLGLGAEDTCEEPAVLLFDVDRVQIDIDEVNIDAEGSADIRVQQYGGGEPGDDAGDAVNDTENETNETENDTDTNDTDVNVTQDTDVDQEVNVDQDANVTQSVDLTQAVEVNINGELVDRAESVDDVVIVEDSESTEFIVVDDPDEDVVFVVLAVENTCEPLEGEVFTTQSTGGTGATGEDVDVQVPAPGLLMAITALAFVAVALGRRRRA